MSGLRAGVPFALYGWRLRHRLGEELLAAAGIMVGVALVLGVLQASTGVTRSGGETVRGVIGNATLQLSARSPEGFDQRLGARVAGLAGVEHWGEVLRADIVLAGPHGRVPAQLAGVSAGIVTLGGLAQSASQDETFTSPEGVLLPGDLAARIGAHSGGAVTVFAGGVAHRVTVGGVLSSARYGPVGSSPVAVARLVVAQELTGTRGRVTQIFVQPAPGAQARVQRELRALAGVGPDGLGGVRPDGLGGVRPAAPAGGRLDVLPADHEVALLDQAFRPGQLATNMFALISAMVGFLLAGSAMLVTVPERRRFLAELRILGYSGPQVTIVLLTHALLLGLVSSLAGVALGVGLSHALFEGAPAYLSFTFPIGSREGIAFGNVMLALGAGVFAALMCSLPPLLDLRDQRALDTALRERGDAGQAIPRRVVVGLGVTAVALVVVATGVSLAVPAWTEQGGVLLAIAAGCAVPAACRVVLRGLMPFAERLRGMGSLALIELDATAMRSTALAGVAALVMYGTVAVDGSRRNVQQSMAATIGQYEHTASIWVTTGDNVFDTDAFSAPGLAAKLARVPGVAAVREYQGALLDVGDRRVLIRAHEPSAPEMLTPLSIIHGGYAQAQLLLRAGGWASVSEDFAREHGLYVGSTFTLPTPSGSLALRVAATTTNMGWPPGLISMSSADYARGWLSSEPSALEVDLHGGADPAATLRAVRAVLAAYPGLQAQSAAQATAQADSEMRAGLAALAHISTLLLIVGALAIATSLSAAIWQRRARLASMRAWGYDRVQLWSSVVIESAVLLAIGCALGMLLGIDGHIVGTRFLRITGGFPAAFALEPSRLLLTLLFVGGVSLVVVALPGVGAVRTSPTVGFQE